MRIEPEPLQDSDTSISPLLSELARFDRFMPTNTYFDPEIFEIELSELFPRSWMLVGDARGLKRPGDYFTETIGREPVLILKDRNDQVRVYSNVCSHRACTLLEGQGNCAPKLVCPYHGWTYKLDGQLVGVPHRQEFEFDLDIARLGLKQLRFEVWAGLVFVNVDGQAPALSEYLGPTQDVLKSHRIDELDLAHHIDDVVSGCNWKIMIDNAFCEYHLLFVHRDSAGKFLNLTEITTDIHDHVGYALIPWSEPYLSKVRKDYLQGDARIGSVLFSAFPNCFISAYPNGSATIFTWTPLSIDSTRAQVWSYSPDPERDERQDFAMLEKVQREDYATCQRVQAGTRSALYSPPGPRHYREKQIWGFQRRYTQMLADALRAREGPAPR